MFTPGPWKYEATTKTLRSDPANYWLASMDSWDGAVDNEANAKLMAAAPDLLALLEDIGKHAIANSHGSFNVSADRIREIRKITAEYSPR